MLVYTIKRKNQIKKRCIQKKYKLITRKINLYDTARRIYRTCIISAVWYCAFFVAGERWLFLLIYVLQFFAQQFFGS